MCMGGCPHLYYVCISVFVRAPHEMATVTSGGARHDGRCCTAGSSVEPGPDLHLWPGPGPEQKLKSDSFQACARPR